MFLDYMAETNLRISSNVIVFSIFSSPIIVSASLVDLEANILLEPLLGVPYSFVIFVLDLYNSFYWFWTSDIKIKSKAYRMLSFFLRMSSTSFLLASLPSSVSDQQIRLWKTSGRFSMYCSRAEPLGYFWCFFQV